MPIDRTPQKTDGLDGKKNDDEEEHTDSEGNDNQEDDEDEPQESDEEEDDPLSLLIYKRGQVKAKVTRARNTLRTDQAMNLPRVQVMKKNLHTFYDEYTRYHNEILDSVNKKGRKDQETKYIEFESLYTSTLEAVQALEIELSTQIPSTSSSHPSTERVIIHQQALKAPLPTFDGRYENWAKFKSMFLDLMKRSHDSDAIKLFHLEKSLVGAAAGVIDIKTINDNNYTRAWQILEDRFENKRNIIDTHIRGLSKLQKMSKESYTELRSLIEVCTRHVDHLEFMEQKLEGVSQLMVVNQLADALDPETRKLWEATLEYGQLPNYKDTIDFLKKRCQILERCQSSTTSTATAAQPKAKPSEKSTPSTTKSVTKSHAATTQQSSDGFSCHLCNKTHPTFRCDEFRALSIAERNKRAKDSNVCFNCLRKGHRLADCTSKKNCMVCKARHNTLLHPDSSSKGSTEKEKSNPPKSEPKISDTSNESQQKVAPSSSAASTSSEAVSCSCSMPHTPNQVLLMTAVVHVLDKNKKVHSCRAFIDPGSMSHMVSKRLAKLLDLPSTPACVTVSGINGIKSTADKRVSIEFRSRTSDFRANISCLVLERVTGSLPVTSIDTAKWGIPPNFDLADPQFNSPDEIDLLVGCGLFWQLLEPDPAEAVVVHSNAAVTSSSLDSLVQKFWELEEVPERSPYTTEEEFCEQHFQKTHSRDEGGRYTVSLPFNDTVNELGDSRGIAIKRFLMLEKRLSRSPDLKAQYTVFMNEYQDLEHCKEIDESNDPPGLQTYYLPHHAVLRPSSSSTKLRVVFDGSANSSSGKSLNDVLQVGPVVQDDLFSIALRFRKYIIAFTADLIKMYRQVRISKNDTRYQRIFWREDPSDQLKVFELSTVTYGTASAPFLATRALKQLAIDERERFPEAAAVVENDFYVDDVLTGAETVGEAIRLQSQLKELLSRGGFPIHKWSSNSRDVIENVPEAEREKPVEIQNASANEIIKTLGLLWDPNADEFLFVVPEIDSAEPKEVTKRYILSQVAKLFDPYGFLSPIGVLAKQLIQRVWIKKFGWDDELSENLLAAWVAYRDALPSIAALRIPRCVVSTTTARVELHGFADASNLAYGACLYLRTIQNDSSVRMQLLCSKSKVAPIQEISIPRKELCAALLMCRLLKKVIPAMKMEFHTTALYSDSEIVLAWLKKSPAQLQIFVRNRTAEINQTAQEHGATFNYIHTADNPADIVSRGQLAEALRVNDLWWHGPKFLREENYQTPHLNELPDADLPELRNIVHAAPVIEEVLPVFTRFSSFRKLQRVVAYVLRFVNNARQKDAAKRSLSTTVTVPEMRAAMSTIVRVIQNAEYGDEIERVQEGEPCRSMANLSPVFEKGHLRVGGRLQHSNLSYERKHPIILPHKNPIVKLLVRAMHQENLHVGPSGLVAATRQRFWITNARSIARQVTRGCVTCFKANPTSIDQQMGSLPVARVTEAPAFAKTGVDFAGPVLVKQGSVRKPTLVKAYIAVFVCMAVKAVHLELVSDLSAPAFIAALQRFVSRRGNPEEIHSDNGLNFVGANHELHDLYELFKKQQTTGLISEFCQPREISWKFIPPRAAHFGGLWEANVKCVKSHLKKILGTTSLNFEEFATLLAQIEAILNSRPLLGYSTDPNDPAGLTPGHFLINRELTAIPEPSYENTSINRLSRWQYIQLLRQRFWRRWSTEYLNQLQGRTKWNTRKPNVKKGMIVIIKEDNAPVQSWKIGKIVDTYPGTDKAVRVVDVLANQTVYRRPITKICPLPIEDNASSKEVSTA